jgi:hypothetical protein
MRRTSDAVDFLLVGPAGERERAQYGDVVRGMDSSRLSLAEYDQRADAIDYAVWTANPNSYRLAASASFLDALSYIKPGLYLRSDFVEYYFNQLGDIGYLCSTHEEMEATARSIVSSFPDERYRQQCANILRGRSVFEPARVAMQLRHIVQNAVSV